MRKLSTATILAVVIALFVATGALALFTNGSFEAGDFSGWTQTQFLNPGLTGPQPFNESSIVRNPGGSDQSLVFGPNAALSQFDANSGGNVAYPAYGSYVARVNGPLTGQISNTIYQETTVQAGDVDPVDGQYHVRFVYSAVMQDPGHVPAEQPWFFVVVKNVTKGNAVLYQKFSYAAEPGVPWQDGAAGWKYLDWSLVDINPGPGALDLGDTISLEAIAADCSLGGHAGYVYVDEFGPFIPGPTIAATGPATAYSGASITYTYNYFNGAAATVDLNVAITAPAGVTFTTGSDLTNCVVASGSATCTFASQASGTGGSFTITGDVTATGGSTISHGDYNIGATGYPTVGGPLVTTVVALTPVISGISPNTGPVTGGTTVIITGTALTGGTVTFDGLPATCTVDSDTQITCTSPAHTAGPIDVVVTTPGGSYTETGGFTYYNVPTISGGGIAPNIGPVAGGTTVVITGTALTGGTVTFDGLPATCTVDSDTQITCTSPAHAAGPVDVAVTTLGGTATATNGFTYVGLPAIGGIAPNSGPVAGGTTVIITGTALTGGTVTFDGLPATCTVDSDTQITCTSPAHAAGPVDVVVTTPGGSDTSTGGFTYIALPETTAVARTVDLSSPIASFVLSTDIGTSFECQMDGGGYTACTSPVDYVTLAPGAHTFEARAIGAGGTDATPASIAWNVKDPVFPLDVPLGYTYKKYIDSIYSFGIVKGCAIDKYCPNSPVTRAELAIMVLRAVNGKDYVPPVHATSSFTDVPVSFWAHNFIEEFYALGYTGGCATNLYCPNSYVTRAQMSVFVTRGQYGPSFTPVAPGVASFTDVPLTHWAFAWIEQFYADGITGGCAPGLYCPNENTPRWQLAVFLVRAFNLPIP